MKALLILLLCSVTQISFGNVIMPCSETPYEFEKEAVEEAKKEGPYISLENEEGKEVGVISLTGESKDAEGSLYLCGASRNYYYVNSPVRDLIPSEEDYAEGSACHIYEDEVITQICSFKQESRVKVMIHFVNIADNDNESGAFFFNIPDFLK